MAIPYMTGPVSIFVAIPISAGGYALLNRNEPPREGGYESNLFRGGYSNAPLQGGYSQQQVPVDAPPNRILTLFNPNVARFAAFLGTGERAPAVIAQRNYTPIYSDDTGKLVPYDRIWEGEEHLVSVVLTRWNEGVYRALAALPRPIGVPGGDSPLDRGSLMVADGLACPLYLRFGHAGKPLALAGGLPAGVRYYAAMLDGQDRYEPGTSVNRRHLTFYCANVYSRNNGNIGLFDYNVAGLPAVPPD